MNFGEMGISEKLIMFSDGQNVAEYFDGVLDKIDVTSPRTNPQPLQPVTLLLLDINMPILNGMEAFNRINNKYNEINEKARAVEHQQSNQTQIVLKPLMCYYS